MKSVLILLACFVAVNCVRYDTLYGYPPKPPKRPDFDCDKWCKYRGVDPKCSESGKTFQNDCYLECNWEYKDCDGVCPCYVKVKKESYCYCKKEKKYVCTKDGTQDNKCIADCKGLTIKHEGKCRDYSWW